MKQTALITGSSSGIGYEFAHMFAQNNYDLVLVARTKKKLLEIKDELAKKYNVSVAVIVQDLSTPAAPYDVVRQLQRKSIVINVLVNNAGFSAYGEFTQADSAITHDIIQVNIASLTHLTRLLLPSMQEAGSGKILNVGSTGSFGPCPMQAVYCATKAYVLSFSEALSEELIGSGITVTAVCPGATKTEFANRAQAHNTKLFRGNIMTARRVAEIGYKACMQGKRVVITGFKNNLLVFASRFTPRAVVTKIAKKLMQTK